MQTCVRACIKLIWNHAKISHLTNKMGENPGFEDFALAYIRVHKFLETLIVCPR
jgi:hypothetical protein